MIEIIYTKKWTVSGEVNYLLQFHSAVVPIGVKAGKSEKLKSLKRLMNEKNLDLGIVISQLPRKKRRGALFTFLFD